MIAVAAYVASVSTAFFIGSVLSNPSNFIVMPDGRSNTGAPDTAAVADGDADEEAAEAVGEAGAEVWMLSELSELPPPQAVSSRPAETAKATAAGRVERVTSESPYVERTQSHARVAQSTPNPTAQRLTVWISWTVTACWDC